MVHALSRPRDALAAAVRALSEEAVVVGLVERLEGVCRTKDAENALPNSIKARRNPKKKSASQHSQLEVVSGAFDVR